MARVGAVLLRLLRTRQLDLLQITPGALCIIRLFSGRTALYLRCEGRRVLLHMDGAFGVSADRDYTSRAWHLELEICIVRHRIEFSECGSSEQGVIATAERDYIED